ncbi:Neurexin-4 [Acropora cervicornis]|uniref:Neurexin-4 n=1 Tax=Acropora cervicornis TaxID=6130 RepID=A0AAD9R1Z9_ACRCE|nr:Neurexin-4 [Acropora cervicornis]
MSKFKVSLRGFNAQLSADTACKEVLMGALSGAMSASSSHSDHPPNSGRLLADTWWMPDQHDVFQYLKVDFSGLAVVRKSAVKGSGNSTAAGARLFVGNLNNSAVISESSFPPFLARHVKFLPQHWHEKIALRVELYGCRSSGT